MKKYIYTICIVLLLCNIFLLLQYKKLEESANIIADKYSTSSITERRINENLKHFSLLYQKYENSTVPLIEEYKNETSFYESISNKDSGNIHLCYRFKETHCDACIQKTLTLINEIEKNFPVKIIILCSYANYNQFAAFRSKQSKNIQIVNIKDIAWEIDSLEQSYFFIIQKGRIQNLFIPLKEDWNYVMKYIQIIQNKFGDNLSIKE